MLKSLSFNIPEDAAFSTGDRVISNLNNFLFGRLIIKCKVRLNRGLIVDLKFVLISSII